MVDEADRLLRQAYQDWLPRVLSLLRRNETRVTKLVVSATLTRDPSKIGRLALHCPRYIALTSGDHRCSCLNAASGRVVVLLLLDSASLDLTLITCCRGRPEYLIEPL